eukprot:c6960_g1_i1.p1 GENE.c6960_g1_i1~~c6960_g1_i1.p1  ORF type:complete len:258 (-),score=35.15 c6960_g1_i1:264-998(-)
MARSRLELEPSVTYLTTYLLLLTFVGMSSSIYLKSLRPRGLRTILHDLGVALTKCARAAGEIERKTFHILGVLVPMTYQILLQFGWSSTQCATLCWIITAIGWACDLLRLYVPFVQDNWPLKSILREKEKNKLCGACFFSLGCTSTISLFPPAIAMASVLFLVLGDLAAAVVGISFGGDACVLKVGREGKKSIEGSVAMFIVCFMAGCSVFAEVHLREYAVFFGALAGQHADNHICSSCVDWRP